MIDVTLFPMRQYHVTINEEKIKGSDRELKAKLFGGEPDDYGPMPKFPKYVAVNIDEESVSNDCEFIIANWAAHHVLCLINTEFDVSDKENIPQLTLISELVSMEKMFDLQIVRGLCNVEALAHFENQEQAVMWRLAV